MLSGFTHPILTRSTCSEGTTFPTSPAPSQQPKVTVGTQGSPRSSRSLMRRQRSCRALPTSNTVPSLNYMYRHILGCLWLINNITSDQILEASLGMSMWAGPWTMHALPGTNTAGSLGHVGLGLEEKHPFPSLLALLILTETAIFPKMSSGIVRPLSMTCL